MGGKYILAATGHWQESNTSMYIYECDKDHKVYCTGNNRTLAYTPNPCTHGHYGPLCKSCDITGKYYINETTKERTKYYSAGNGACAICPPMKSTRNILVLVGLFLFQVFFVIFNMRAALKFQLDALGIKEEKPKPKKKKSKK